MIVAAGRIIFKVSANARKSLPMFGYFFLKAFASLRKLGVGMILYLFKIGFETGGLEFSLPDLFCFI